MFSFYIPEGEKPETFRSEVMERLNRLCDEAKGAPVRLLHENELGIYGDSPERCLDIMETIGYDRMGAVFDPANFINLRERVEIYPYAWNLLKKYVDYMHIKDAVHIDDLTQNHHEVRPAGYGDGRIIDILRDLDRRGYHGFLSIEPHLGNFAGFEKLEHRPLDRSIADGGPDTFTLAAKSLKKLIGQLDAETKEK
jgi:sugar phosphate isomerase/epimerase